QSSIPARPRSVGSAAHHPKPLRTALGPRGRGRVAGGLSAGRNSDSQITDAGDPAGNGRDRFRAAPRSAPNPRSSHGRNHADVNRASVAGRSLFATRVSLPLRQPLSNQEYGLAND